MAAAGATLAIGSARAQGKAKTDRPIDTIVLGAGVSGLNTAALLEKEGQKVLVLEGRQRVGGRVFTLLDQPGYPEMGFNSMGEGYGRGLDAAQRAGVEMVDITPRFYGGPPQELWLNGKRMTREEWARSPVNPFPDALKANLPGEVVGKLVAQHTRLADFSTWNDPANTALDISLNAFLKTQGLSDPAIRLANDLSPYYGMNAFEMSQLMMEFNDGFIKTQIAVGKKSLAVKGGNIHLPLGMAKLIKGDILLGREIVAIDVQPNGVEVRCLDGSVYRAARAVCSLPFSTLRNIAVTPGFTGAQAQAVQTLGYNGLTIAFLTASEPFWLNDGLSPAMFTDDQLGVVMPQRFGADPSQITGLTVQARGNLAQMWDSMGKEAALQNVVARLEALRPAAKGKVKGAAMFSWSQERFTLGQIAYFKPGQVTAFAKVMAAPMGRLHFCGEHTAEGARGLEGALESSERVAIEVLTA
ncbi:FAD-dependent oxidoreductase [Sphingomonas populi]|uniref:FAD-dependent oxidoreductase n=1 Tax=Sphingomonas populi TaxID=2484750 RepID=A0A4Q6Y0C9_9SPHN|nr:NAD(P)/FAD-dependent oxidoreductase [Sphingomonas populi]RZF66035.1 FAD-dependent oxidoreductase [Sphingomonas populi]